MTQESIQADNELRQCVLNWPGPKQLRDLDDQLLCGLARSHGVDFATALFDHAIRASPEHGPFVRRLEELLNGESPPRTAIDATFAIVPGAFYHEHPETGADGKTLCRLAESLGCRTHVIPTESVGRTSVNGRIVCDWLQRNAEQKMILCSLSKGSADVKMALAEPDASKAFRNVIAWLNVGGITAGSPMASWVLDRPWVTMAYRVLFWWRGRDFRFIRDLARGPGAPLDFAVTVPSHIRVIHLLGFPLSHHLDTRPSRHWHRRLSRYGPNDAVTTLIDSCALPGLMFPVWGADHYLDIPYSREKLLTALLHYLGEELKLFARPIRSISLVDNCVAT
jgi:hypothetical protein